MNKTENMLKLFNKIGEKYNLYQNNEKYTNSSNYNVCFYKLIDIEIEKRYNSLVNQCNTLNLIMPFRNAILLTYTITNDIGNYYFLMPNNIDSHVIYDIDDVQKVYTEEKIESNIKEYRENMDKFFNTFELFIKQYKVKKAKENIEEMFNPGYKDENFWYKLKNMQR